MALDLLTLGETMISLTAAEPGRVAGHPGDYEGLPTLAEFEARHGDAGTVER